MRSTIIISKRGEGYISTVSGKFGGGHQGARADLADLKIIVDEDTVLNLAGAAARRALAGRNRRAGASVRTAEKLASGARPTAEMIRVVRSMLGRGNCYEVVIRAAMRAANFTLLGLPPREPR